MTARYIEATGATDGSIIAAIMTTHSGRNSPNTSHGPLSTRAFPGFAGSAADRDAKLGARLPMSIRFVAGFVSAASGRDAHLEKKPLGPDPARLVWQRAGPCRV